MARNRKHQSAAIRFGPALKALVLCLLIGGSGVGYVWQKNQIYELGQQIRRRELDLAALQSQNESLKRQLARMCSVSYLEARNAELKLGLGPVPPQQKWLLKLPASGSATDREPNPAPPARALTQR